MTSHLSQKIFAAVALLALSSSSSASASATTYAKLGANGIVFSSTTNNSQSGSPSVSGPNGQSSNISTGAGGVVIGSGIAFVPSVGPVNLSASSASTYMSLLFGPVNASNPIFAPPVAGPSNTSATNFIQTASSGGNGVSANVTYQFSSQASTGPANSTTNLTLTWSGTGSSGPYGGTASFIYNYRNVPSTALPAWVDQTPIAFGTGAVLSNPTTVYVIYYGALTYGTTFWTNTAKTSLINSFISKLSSSAWFSAAKQYGVGDIVIGKTITVDCLNTGRDGNRYVAPGSCTMRPDSQFNTLQSFVTHIIWRNIYLANDDINGLSPDFPGIYEVMDPSYTHFLLPKDPNGIYLVLGGPETYEQWSYPSSATIGQDYCGYHGQFSADAVGDNVYQFMSGNAPTSPFYNLKYPRKDGYVYNYIYATVPVTYSVAIAQGGSGSNPASKCVYPFNVNNSPNSFPEIDMLFGIIAHELVETLISPAPFQTYSDSDGNEVMDKCLGLYLDLINQGSYSFNAVVGNILVVLPHIWSKTGGCLQLVPVTTSSAPAVTSVLIDNFATQNINVAYKQTSTLVGGGTSSWSSGALQINPSAGSYFTTVTATCANVGASALSYIQVVASVPAGDTFNVVVYATNSACNGLSPTAAQNVAGNQYLVSTSSSGVSTFLIPITTSLFPNGIWAINLQQWSSSATVTLYSISFTSGASTAATTTTTSAAASSATSIVIDNFLSANVNSAYHQTSALVGGGTSSWSSGSLLFSPATGGYFTSTTATCANTNAALPFIQFTAAIPAGETFSVVVYATNSACNGVAPTASQNTAVVSSTSALTTYRVPLTASLFPNGIWSVNLQSWSSTAQIQITSISFSS